MFWDSSAVIPYLLAEDRSAEITQNLVSDRNIAIWWATPVECQSAIYRTHREATLPRVNDALERLAALVQDAHTVAPTEELRRRAGQVLASHRLRAADALQLAAALSWSEGRPADEAFVCLDDRLRDAARREGFRLFPD